MASDDRAKLQQLISDGIKGLRPELLRYLPRPLSAPRSNGHEDVQVARAEMDAEAKAATAAERAALARAAADAQSYRISDELLHAVQVALLLRQPLLLTGDPGVGKTRFARALAGLLGAAFERIDVKTTTTGRDLLYSIDDIARFRDASVGRAPPNGKTAGDGQHPPSADKALKDYVELAGLGRAVLRAAGPDYRVQPGCCAARGRR